MAAGIASEAVPEDEVLARAVAIASGWRTRTGVIAADKSLLYGEAIAITTTCAGPDPATRLHTCLHWRSAYSSSRAPG